MELGNLRPFRHSGKFGVQALLVVPLVAGLLGGPLGFAYGYLVKWIPFVYLNLLITFGYGLVLGVVVGAVLKWCRVRNVAVATVLAALVGVLGNYFQWNGHLHALLGDGPWLIHPRGMWAAMQLLLAHGSWSLRSGGNVTGWFLATVWAVEAGVILVMVVYLGTDPVRNTPYCEKSGTWLDEEKTFETLARIDDAQELASLKAGDIAPVIAARPRPAGATAYAKLTLKYSPRCEEFFTILVANVTITTNRKDETKVETVALTENLVLPHAMRPLVEQFADLKPVEAAAPSAPSVTV